MTHTPGPWRTIEVTDLVTHIRNEKTVFVAACPPANARLIAAAPDLLVALEVALRRWEQAERISLNDPDYERITAAIQKARGR